MWTFLPNSLEPFDLSGILFFAPLPQFFSRNALQSGSVTL